MPQASQELRDRWETDQKATDFLIRQGYKLLSTWEWLVPLGHKPTDDEMSAIEFMADEWDYGGPVMERPA